jgi:hypothetical protein
MSEQSSTPAADAPSHRTDTVLGLVVTALGSAILIGALAMPRFEHRSADPLTVPGITPGLLGAIILVLGLTLTVRGARRQGSDGPLSITSWSPQAVPRTLFTLGALLIYGFALFGKLPFVPATTAFIFAFTVGVELMREDRRSSLAKTVIGAAVLAVVASLVIWAVFSEVFLIQLPG